MSRVLVVAVENRTRETVTRVLRADSHEVFEAQDVDRVVYWTTHEVLDLVVAELEPPGMTANALRETVGRGLSPRTVPFVFIRSGQAHGDTLESLAATDDLFLLGTPLNLHLLAWLARSITSNTQQLQGTFAESSLLRLLEHVHRNADTGVLTAYRDTWVKKVCFSRGHLVAGGTETLLDLFLWDDGDWAYERGRPQRAQVTNGIDLRLLLEEGARRVKRWKRLRSLFPDDEMHLTVVPDHFPAGFPETKGDARLIELMRAGLTLGQIRAKLPGQDYGVFARLSEFLKLRVIELPPIAPSMNPDEDEADHSITLDPARPGSRDRVFARRFENTTLGRTHVVQLRIPVRDLLDQSIPSYEVFLLSRLAAGAMKIGRLMDACPMEEAQVLEILDRYIQRGVVGVGEEADEGP